MKPTMQLLKFLTLFLVIFLHTNKSMAQCSGYTAQINKTSDGFFVNDISLQVTITGGSGSINSVEWYPYASGITAHNRGAGTHMAIVRDTFYGCVDTAYLTVTDTFNCKYLRAGINQWQDSCNYNDVTLQGFVHLGSGTYSYLWNTGETGDIIRNKTTGTYTLTVTDIAYSCSDTVSIAVVDDTCDYCKYFNTYIFETDPCGLNDVRLEAYVYNYNTIRPTYQWNTGASSQIILNQTSGVYSVTITDTVHGCIDTVFYNLQDDTCSPCQYFQLYLSGYEGCKPNDVRIFTNFFDSLSTTFLWNTGETTSFIANKSTGTYTVIAFDTNGCRDTASVYMRDSVYRCCNANYYLASDSFHGDSSLLSYSNYFQSNASSDAPIIKYNWSFGDGFDGSGSYVFHQFANTGVKTICHYVEDTSGCKDTFCKTKNLPPNGQNIGVKTFHTPFVPGRPCNYYIFYSNLGNTVVSNVELSLYYPANMIFNTASTGYSTTTDAIHFGIGSMNIGQSGYILVSLTTPTNFTVGSQKMDSTIIKPLSGDVVLYNNSIVNYDLVRGSYDPNEILVSPSGQGEDGNINPNTKELGYMINFQNEGSWRTYKVKVENEVDPSMDIHSLLIGETSHQVRLVVNGRKLIWYFDDIDLSPKSIDEPRSHGFIQYTMKLKENLPVGTTIRNTANIYFDYNEAVTTNTAKSTLFLKSASSIRAGDSPGLDFDVQKRNDKLVIHSDHKMSQVRIYSVDGKLIEEQQLNANAVEINTMLSSQQIYMIHVEIGDQIVIKKFQF